MSLAKGQAFTSEFVVASMVFIIVVIMLNVYTHNMYEKIDRQENMLEYENLLSTTDTFLLYHGYPEKWNPSDVEVLGIAERPNYINSTKLEMMMNDLTDDQIKHLLHMEGYSFNLTVTKGGTTLYSKGSDDWSDAENIYIVNRKAIMDDESIKIKFLVW